MSLWHLNTHFSLLQVHVAETLICIYFEQCSQEEGAFPPASIWNYWFIQEGQASVSDLPPFPQSVSQKHCFRQGQLRGW